MPGGWGLRGAAAGTQLLAEKRRLPGEKMPERGEVPRGEYPGEEPGAREERPGGERKRGRKRAWRRGVVGGGGAPGGSLGTRARTPCIDRDGCGRVPGSLLPGGGGCRVATRRG